MYVLVSLLPSLSLSAFLFCDYESMFDGVWEKATIVGVEMRSGRIVASRLRMFMRL